jgi:hypothetical protein
MRLKAWLYTTLLLWAALGLSAPTHAWEDDEPDWATDTPLPTYTYQAQAAPQATPQAAPQATGRVALFVNPPEASIYIDGVYQGQGQYVGMVPLGPHMLRFELPNHLTVQEVITAEAGDGPIYLVVHMRPLQTSSPVAVGRTGGWVDDFDANITAWSLTGGGAVLAISGAILLAIDGKPSCQGCSGRFETTAAGATLTGLGAATLTAGVTLFLWDQLAGHRPYTAPAAPSERWSVGVSPTATADGDRGGQVVLGGRW